MPAALALAALLVLVWIGARGSHANASAPPPLDPTIPPDLKATVLRALTSVADPQKLRTLAATLPGYPKAQAALEARAKVIEAALQKNAARINTLLAQIKDPAWRDKVQAIVMKTTDLPSLEILRGFFSVGEPAAAEILGLKIAALLGLPAYSPPPMKEVVNVPGVFNLFATGQYQGCENQPGCNVADAKFGTGPGPMGLDAGLANLTPEAAESLAGLLVFLPQTFATTFKASAFQDPVAAFVATLGAIARGVGLSLPMTATALRYKASFLAPQILTMQAAHTGAGIPVIVGQASAWLRAQHPAHHSGAGPLILGGAWPTFEDPRGGVGPSANALVGLLYPFHRLDAGGKPQPPPPPGPGYVLHRGALDAGGKPPPPPPPGPGYAQWARRGLPLGHNVWL